MHKVALSCNAKPEIAQNTYLSVYINLYLNVYLTSDNPYYVSDQKRAANFMNMIMIKNALNNQ